MTNAIAPKFVEYPDGLIVLGDFPSKEVASIIFTWLKDVAKVEKFPLVIADPPYGNILNEEWDETGVTDVEFADFMFGWTEEVRRYYVEEGAALYVWGGVGRSKQIKTPATATKPAKIIPSFRPFYRFLSDVENRTGWSLGNHITWSKKRAYGTSWNYLFTREECAYLVNGDAKKPRKFTVPLRDEKRSYAGYSAKYPAKSEFYRRTNVWTDVWDVTELLRGKIHPAEKPAKLAEIMIGVHTNPGEVVLDPFAGSGSTAIAARETNRRFVLVECNEDYFGLIRDRLDGKLEKASKKVSLEEGVGDE
jgi:DNA modification methylase